MAGVEHTQQMMGIDATDLLGQLRLEPIGVLLAAGHGTASEELKGVVGVAVRPTGIRQLEDLLAHPLSRLMLLLIGWAVCHHLYAGIRYLLIDVDIGVELRSARMSAALVMTAALVSTLVILVLLV